ncbi:MAG: NAD-dependent epimerase/dehydratase family protein [Armatimonadetes bacterium]|nr:NAD-dependent epimerase/dehydratase family protein [Armatimonadota bacterium]
MYLVTGGSGFIGAALVRRLRAAGAAVRIMDLRPPADIPESEMQAGRLEYLRGDVTSSADVVRALRGVNCVFHLAAQMLLSLGGSEMHRVNVQGTQMVLEAARRAEVNKVVYVSTAMLCGSSPGRPTREDDPPAPSGPYAVSKIDAELVCREYLARGMEIAILRPLFVLGRGRLGLLHLLFDRVQRGRPLYLVGGGRNRFHMIGVDDLAEACVLASAAGHRGVFNVGVENPTPVRTQMEALRDHAGTATRIRPLPVWLVRAAVKVLSLLRLSPIQEEQQKVAWQDRVLDTTRARRELGWTHTRSDVELLLETYDWYQIAKTQPRDHASDWPDGGVLKWKWIDRFL